MNIEEIVNPENSASNTYGIVQGQLNPKEFFDPQRLFWKRAVEERAYIVSETFTGSGNVHLENPVNSGTTAFFTLVETPTQYPAHAQVHDSFDGDVTGGTSSTPENILMDSSEEVDSGALNVFTDVSFTSTGTHANSTYGGGSVGQRVGDTGSLSIFGLEEGREIVIELEDTSGQESDLGTISAVYFEVDEIFSDNQ